MRCVQFVYNVYTVFNVYTVYTTEYIVKLLLTLLPEVWNHRVCLDFWLLAHLFSS